MTKPRLPRSRKAVGTKRQPHQARRLLTVRSALVLQLALLTAFGGAGLLILAHTAIAETALGGAAIFAAAIKFYDTMIE